MRRAGAANMVLCTSIQTIDEHETDTHGGGVHTQMSREAWPIQIAIIGAEGQISDALQAFSGPVALPWTGLAAAPSFRMRRTCGGGCKACRRTTRSGNEARRSSERRNRGRELVFFASSLFYIQKSRPIACKVGLARGRSRAILWVQQRERKGRLVAAPGTNEKTGFALRSHERMRAAGAAGGVGAKERRSVCLHRGGQAGCPSAGRPCQFGRSG